MRLNLTFQLFLRFSRPKRIDVIQYERQMVSCLLCQVGFDAIVGISQTDGNFHLVQDIAAIEDSLADLDVAHSRHTLPVGHRVEDRSSSPVLRQQRGMHHYQSLLEVADQL